MLPRPSSWQFPQLPGESADMLQPITTDIRTILRQHGRLAVDVDALADDSNLYEAGLTSHASVNLMLALEEHFQIEFSERMLQRRTFATIASIRSCLDELVGASA